MGSLLNRAAVYMIIQSRCAITSMHSSLSREINDKYTEIRLISELWA
ncbi:MAG: hypothetical protein U0Z17_01855 [Bacteroidales bacterium]